VSDKGGKRPSRLSTPKDLTQRDLRFVDATGTRTLSPEQIAAYNRQGYYEPLTAYSADEIVPVRAYFDHLFELLRAQGNTDNYALVGYHTRCPGLFDIVMNPKIVDTLEDIMGPDILCWSTQAFCKVPGDPVSVAFHQDGSYWPLDPASTVTAWLAIDDSDRENSCLQVIAGTHKLGQLPWSKAAENALLDQEMDNPTAYGAPHAIELKAGQFSLHAAMTAHGSDPNTSSRRRCGFVIRYCPPSVKPLDADWSRNAILCRGADTTGYWGYSKRPQQDDVGDWKSYWIQKYREGALNIKGGNIGA
jgi:non-haem Fe2+, alpha-ketoglutarate-dependent halogenase